MENNGESTEKVLRFYFGTDFSASMKTSIIIFAFLFIFFIVMGIIFDKMRKKDKEVPKKGILFLVVLFVETINEFVSNNLGKQNRKIYSPFFIGISAFLSLANIASVFGLNPPFANLGVALSLSVIAFIIFQFTGLKFQGLKERINGFMGPVKGVSFLVFPISLIGEVTTPFSMGMRMFGNLFSGVIIAGVVLAATEALGAALGAITATLAFAIIIHPIFDIFFGLLQMYVYFMLSTMFIKQNM